jgi:hypothetical protein
MKFKDVHGQGGRPLGPPLPSPADLAAYVTVQIRATDNSAHLDRALWPRVEGRTANIASIPIKLTPSLRTAGVNPAYGYELVLRLGFQNTPERAFVQGARRPWRDSPRGPKHHRFTHSPSAFS